MIMTLKSVLKRKIDIHPLTQFILHILFIHRRFISNDDIHSRTVIAFDNETLRKNREVHIIDFIPDFQCRNANIFSQDVFSIVFDQNLICTYALLRIRIIYIEPHQFFLNSLWVLQVASYTAAFNETSHPIDMLFVVFHSFFDNHYKLSDKLFICVFIASAFITNRCKNFSDSLID